MKVPDPLFLHHEILLLALRDDHGTLGGGMAHYGMAGAMVSELLLQQRIIANDDKPRTVAVIDETPPGDDVLDELLQMISSSRKHRGLSDWVMKAAQIKQLHHRVAQPLCESGVLRAETRKVLFVFTRQIYPELNGTVEDHIRDRMASIMFHEGVKPDDRTAVLIALASQASLLSQNFAPVELKQHRKRIQQLADGKILAAEATGAAIAAVQAAIMTATMVPLIVASTHS